MDKVRSLVVKNAPSRCTSRSPGEDKAFPVRHRRSVRENNEVYPKCINACIFVDSMHLDDGSFWALIVSDDLKIYRLSQHEWKTCQRRRWQDEARYKRRHLYSRRDKTRQEGGLQLLCTSVRGKKKGGGGRHKEVQAIHKT